MDFILASLQTMQAGCLRSLVFLFLFIFICTGCATKKEPAFENLTWQSLPDLPQPLSGQFAGISGGSLLVIGGTNFPVPLFEGGSKVWYDSVYVLEPGGQQWRAGKKLDHPLAYGGSVTNDDGVICLGGSDSFKHYAAVFRLRYLNGKVERTSLPDLPQPVAMMGSARLGETIYIAGGQSTPDSTTALNTFWALNLADIESGWKQLDPWPGAGRILPVVVSQSGAVYVMSGATLSPGSDGKSVRRYLNDAYKFTPKSGWQRIADLPRPVVAAPVTDYGQAHIFVFGGDDGKNALRVQELKDNHPGFSRDILAYHTITDTWVKTGSYPQGLVTTSLVMLQDWMIIPGGEDRPGHRSAKVTKASFNAQKGNFDWIDYSVLAIYLLPNLMLGFYLSKRNKTTQDFFLGGGRVPWWAAGLSIYGTQLSAITYLAIPAKAFAEDWTYVIAQICIILVTPIVVFFYLPFFRRLNVTTAYEYLEKRFNLTVRLFGSASFILLQAGRMAIVMFLPAIALAAVSGLNVYLSILIMGLLCTIYTMKGGIEAVIWTDVIQSIVLIGGALVALVLVVTGIDGGLGQVISTGWKDGKFHMFNWTWDYTTTAVWVVLFGNLLSVLIPYTTDQAVIQKYLTTKNEKQSARAIWTNAWLTIPTALIFFGLGVSLYVFYKTHPWLLNPELQTDATFAWFIAQQMPVGLAGLVVAGVFAAAMSTLSSSMNSIATAIVTDFYVRIKPDASDDKRLKLARRLTLVLGLVGTVAALLMATYNIKSLWDLFLQILGLFGGGLAGIFALGIFTRRAHGKGVVVGIVASIGALILIQRYTNTHFFLYGAVGILTAFIVGYVASLLIPSESRSLKGLTIFTIERQTTGVED